VSARTLKQNETNDAFDTELVRGDAARDAAAWEAAARHYRRALQIRPQDAGIWMQLGHAVKEQGDVESAEAAYLTAQRLWPDNGDVALQLGHLHMLKGEPEIAVPHYQRARALGINDEHALHVLTRAGADFDLAPLAEGAPIPVVYLDVSDLVAYFRDKRFPTGIQRMEIELVKASRSWQGEVPLRICSYVNEAVFWVDVDPASLCDLCDLAAAPGTVLDPSWRAAVTAFHQRLEQRPACGMPVGAALINLGPWWSIDYMAVVREAKARCGLRYVPFVHDLIPLNIPEHLPSTTAAIFSYWLGSALMHADAVMVNSECTRRDLMRVAERVRVPRQMPVVVRLDAQLGSHRAMSASEQRLVLERFGLADRNFVLFVSTLEARKNHLLAFRTWTRLLDRHPTGSLPLLVCVGRRGWHFDQTEMFLETHKDLQRHVILLSEVSDIELQALYQACLFTAYSSFYEGWGLPITESLCFGKVCLTADHSSLPEAGGEFAEYYEEDSVRSMTGKAEVLIFDVAYREERERMIAESYRPRTWDQVLAAMVNGVLPQLLSPQTVQTGIAPVEFGTIYEIGQPIDATMPDRFRAVGEMLRADQGWHSVEAWGVFSKQARATLLFMPDLAAVEPPDVLSESIDVLVYLKLRASEEQVDVLIQVESAPSIRVSLMAREQRILQTRCPLDVLRSSVMQQAPIALRLNVDRMTALRRHSPNDVRQIGIGVEFFAICLETDMSTRMTMIERCCLQLCGTAPGQV